MNSTRLSRLALMGLGVMSMFAAPVMAQPVLTLEGTCPGTMRAQAEGMRPRATAFLYFSPARGSYTFPPFHMCSGVEVGLDVRRLRLVGTARIDDSGSAFWEGAAHPRACGGFLQVIDNVCRITNVIEIH